MSEALLHANDRYGEVSEHGSERFVHSLTGRKSIGDFWIQADNVGFRRKPPSVLAPNESPREI